MAKNSTFYLRNKKTANAKVFLQTDFHHIGVTQLEVLLVNLRSKVVNSRC